jgi:Ser/Thr protein kinase RdoA (MazF antagonist)
MVRTVMDVDRGCSRWASSSRSEAAILASAGAFAEGVEALPERPLHGDLHLDNVLFNQDMVFIYDFDVSGVAPAGQHIDIGVAIHRQVRAVVRERALGAPGPLTSRVVDAFCGGYRAETGGGPDVATALRAATGESVKKFLASAQRAHAEDRTLPWARFRRNHLQYLMELLELAHFLGLSSVPSAAAGSRELLCPWGAQC